MILYDSRRTALTLGRLLARGGEGSVYLVEGRPGQLAKVYTPAKPDYEPKLIRMRQNPPLAPGQTGGHHAIAWPADLLYDKGGAFLGYLMPHVQHAVPLFDVFNPRRRAQTLPGFDVRYLHRTARNLAAAVAALHARDYVIGDLNESNVLVTPTALVTLIDTDSFQVIEHRQAQIVIYPCPVGKPEYTPPELQGKTFIREMRQAEHDRFGLAVLVFQLLMAGSHPYRSRWLGAGDPPSVAEKIAKGWFPYAKAPAGPVAPPSFAPPLEWLHPPLADLVRRCFEGGHLDARLRPPAAEWTYALAEAERALVSCPKGHIYSGHLRTCPVCGSLGRATVPPAAARSAAPTPRVEPAGASRGATPPAATPPTGRAGSPPPRPASATTGRSATTPPASQPGPSRPASRPAQQPSAAPVGSAPRPGASRQPSPPPWTRPGSSPPWSQSAPQPRNAPRGATPRTGPTTGVPSGTPFGGVRSQIRWEWLRAFIVTWLMIQLGLKPQPRTAPPPPPPPPPPRPIAPRRSRWATVRRTAALVTVGGAIAAATLFAGDIGTWVAAQRDRLPSRLPSLAAPAPLLPTYIVQVDARQGWYQTSLSVEAGTRVDFEWVDGQWTTQTGQPTTGPEGSHFVCSQQLPPSQCAEPLPGAPRGSLIARLGDQVFSVPASGYIIASQSGALAFRINDADAGLADNDGQVRVKVRFASKTP